MSGLAAVVTKGVRMALALLVSALLVGMESGEAGGQSPRATHKLAADHWAVEAVRTAHAVGLEREYFPAEGAVPAGLVDRVLRAAAREAAGDDYAALTEGWLRRWEAEFGDGLRREGMGAFGGVAGLDLTGGRGMAVPGRGLLPAPEDGPRPRPARLAAEAHGGAWAAFPHLAVAAAPRLGPGVSGLESAEVAVQAGVVRASLARGGVGYARGIVVNAAAPLDHASLSLSRPVRLPGFLRHIGPVTLHTFGGVLPDERHGDRPWLWGARAAARPHPRLTIGVNRAAMLAGEDNPTPATPMNLLNTFIGRHVGDLADQIVSVDARWRLPTPEPATLYLEWGAEDSAGSWYNVPGIVVGAFVPALPGLPTLSAGAEHAYFGHSRVVGDRVNPPWYRHRQFTGGWVVGERMLGHPVGGNGAETAVYGRLSEPRTRIDVRGRAFLRNRRPENLFSPQRAGRSLGGEVVLDWRPPLAGSTIRFDVRTDVGAGWREVAARLGFDIHF